MPNFITWDPSKIIFQLGSLQLRWYSAFWIIGLAAAFFVVLWLYRSQKIEQSKFEPLFIYCFIGILAGARLGHCLFYDPGYFLSHPLEIFIPAQKMADGSWHFTGYAGLASHGGTLGLMLALWIYVKRMKMPLWTVVDNIAIATPITACCIRLGNLFNSEIVGKPTTSDLGFIFVQNGEDFARYPAQLYEALAYFVFFFIGVGIYLWRRRLAGTGFFMGLCITCIFTFRFFIEFLKEVQEGWELDMVQAIGLNQGQMLSIPFVILGIVLLIKLPGAKKAKTATLQTSRNGQ